MDNEQALGLRDEEKLFGLFSHLSIFFGGIIIPIIFWAINKDKSKFVSFHSLQALFFHLLYAVVIIVFVFVMVIAGLALGFFSASHHSATGAPIFVIGIILFYAFLFITIIGVMAYSIFMGIKAYHGELRKYPIVGHIVYRKVYGSV